MRLVVKDLIPGQQYSLQFRSKNAGEISEWGNTYLVTAGTPESKPLTPTGVTLDAVGDSFNARWNVVTMSDDGSPATDLAGYVVKFRNVLTSQSVVFVTSDTSFELTFNLNTAAFSPLAGTVGVQVAARSMMGQQSDWSAEVIAQNPAPNPVQNLTAISAVDSIVAKWDAPATLEDDFKEYRAYVGTTSGFIPGPSNMFWRGVGTSATYNTTSNVDHYVKVITYDKFDTPSTTVTAGPVRPKSSATIDTNAPDTPTNLNGSISGQRLTVTWTAPANPDGDLAGYQISYRPVGQTGWSYATASHADTSLVIEPINRYVNYESRIQAHDFSFNYSPWSTIKTINGETNTAPAVPTGLQVKGAITSATLVWNANTEPDLAGYEVQFKAGLAPVDGDQVYPTASRVITFSENVTNNTTYYARVRAVDTQGLKSAWSSVVSGTVGFVDFEGIEDRLDDTITSYVVEYAVNASETVPPASGWSTSTPTRTPGTFIWYRALITYGDSSTTTSSPALLTGNTGATGSDGTPAKDVSLTATTQVLTSPAAGGATNPTTSVVTGTATNTTISVYEYSVDGAAFSTNVPTGVSRTGNTVTITGGTMTARTITVRMADSGGVADTLTVAKVADGATGGTGSAGADAYTVLLTNEAHTFPGSTTAALAGSVATNVLSYKGTAAIASTVGTITGQVTGLTTAVTNNGTTSPTITITVTTSLTATSGLLTIPLTIDGKTFTKTFSWTVSREGAAGSAGTPAATINLTANTQVLSSPAGGGATNPATATVTGTATNTTISVYEYSVDGAAFSATVPTGVSRTGNVVTITGSTMTAKTITVRMASAGGTADTLTVAKVFDGAAGSPGGSGPAGADAYTVLLTNEAHIFPGTTTTASAGSTSTNVLSFKGTAAVNATVGTITGQVTGLTTAVTNNGTASPLITITVTTALTQAGTLTIPVTVDGQTFNKRFSWTIGFTGATGNQGSTGVGITSVTPYYLQQAEGAAAPAKPTVNPPGGSWTTTEPTYTAGTSIYRTERILYTNSTFAYTDVSKMSAYEAAKVALATANGKNKVTYSTGDPGTTANTAGDIWFKFDNATNRIIGQWEGRGGTTWVAKTLDNAVIATLDAAKITTGFLDANRIQANTIGADKIKTAEIAADSAFLGALVVGNANISSLEANKLTAGSGLIANLSVKSTLTMGDASTNGIIQSFGYNGSAGYQIDKSSITIKTGAIEAAALRIQTGQNLIPPAYADFELPNWFYSTGLASTNMNCTVATGGRFNAQSLALRNSTSGQGEVWMGTSSTDYNIPVEAGQTYIVSAYFKGGVVAGVARMRLKFDNATVSADLSSTNITVGSGWQRLSGTVTVPAGVTRAIFGVYCPTSSFNAGFDIDGVQVEQKIGALTTPSPWSPPSETTINGASIRTGEIRSNQTVTVNGVQQPMWSINTNGGMQIGSAVVRGALTIGATSDAADSHISSSNYVPGASGFHLRGSDGYADFRNLASDIIGVEHLKAGTLSADNITAGNLHTTIGISTDGMIIAGNPTGSALELDYQGITIWNSIKAESEGGGEIDVRLDVPTTRLGVYGVEDALSLGDGINVNFSVNSAGDVQAEAINSRQDAIINGMALMGAWTNRLGDLSGDRDSMKWQDPWGVWGEVMNIGSLASGMTATAGNQTLLAWNTWRLWAGRMYEIKLHNAAVTTTSTAAAPAVPSYIVRFLSNWNSSAPPAAPGTGDQIAISRTYGSPGTNMSNSEVALSTISIPSADQWQNFGVSIAGLNCTAGLGSGNGWFFTVTDIGPAPEYGGEKYGTGSVPQVKRYTYYFYPTAIKIYQHNGSSYVNGAWYYNGVNQTQKMVQKTPGSSFPYVSFARFGGASSASGSSGNVTLSNALFTGASKVEVRVRGTSFYTEGSKEAMRLGWATADAGAISGNVQSASIAAGGSANTLLTATGWHTYMAANASNFRVVTGAPGDTLGGSVYYGMDGSNAQKLRLQVDVWK